MRLTNSALSDDSILLQIKQGSRDAFDMLYARYWEKAYAISYKRLKDHSQSQDIVQDIFVHVWLKREELVILNFQAYLAVSVRNQVFKLIAKQKLTSPFFNILHELPATYSEADAGIRWKEFYRSYEALLTSLPSKRQTIFRLRFQDDMPTKDIANQLGLSVKTVQNQLGKAIKQLRISLQHLLTVLAILLSQN
ncbi:MAG TPA: sigma-70 family RNA polymerase sigma factor [Sphingobacteriaceae bacterium]|nr:sigma-70 family RNA polymerase sigma factor [Sphingobacteriaceae bacterium]